jgi:hypothetical protein
MGFLQLVGIYIKRTFTFITTFFTSGIGVIFIILIKKMSSTKTEVALLLEEEEKE